MKNLLKLPDGTELFSGNATGNAIKSVTLTQCVNSERELTLGSTCANMVEATLITPNGGLSLTAGDEVILYKVDDEGTLHQVGVFILEQPTRSTANTMKLTGYDRVTKLDKDLTEWLKGLNGWPYNILTFASMVCEACGLVFAPGDVPNSSYQVEQFSRNGVTGRQIMKWIGEVCCRFCRATPSGDIELGWYEQLTTHTIGYKESAFLSVTDDGAGNVIVEGIDVQSSDDGQGNVTIESDRLTVTDDGQGNVVLTVQDLSTLVYFQNGLSYEDYTVAPVDAVQIQFAEGESAYRWPEAPEGANCYVIGGNPMLSSTADTVAEAIGEILAQLSHITYTPCKVSIPTVLDLQPGHIVRIADKNKKSLTMLVMSKVTAGQKDTYECTGSPRRDSTAAQNNQSPAAIAQQKVDAQTQEEIFKKLTNGGEKQGIYLQDGILYINAEYVKSGKLDAEIIDGSTLNITNGATIAGFSVGNGNLTSGTINTDSFIGLYSSYPSTTKIGNIESNNWRIIAGKSFGVTKDGVLSASNVDITGGKIGGWDIREDGLMHFTETVDGGNPVYDAWIHPSGFCNTIRTPYDDDKNGIKNIMRVGSNFHVRTDGTLYATNANIIGTITATSGSFKGKITSTEGDVGGWKISEDTLYGETGDFGPISISPTGVTGLFTHPDGYTTTDLVSWFKILSAAMAWTGE